jgi:hypothetical protein
VVELVGIQYAMSFVRVYCIVDVLCAYMCAYSDIVGVSILLRLRFQPLLLDEQWRGRKNDRRPQVGGHRLGG